MNRYSLLIEEYACWGCKTCEVACKQEYNPVDADSSIKYLSVWPDGPKLMNGKLDFVWRVNVCKHCDEPICAVACPEGAIREEEREVGYTEQGTAIQEIDFVHGVLNVGEPMATPVIRAVKEYYKDGYVKIIDAPPGTSCPVVKTIADADMVVLVTEPTPFGLHDLKIAVSVARTMDKPVGVVINRDQGEYAPLKDYLSQNSLPLLMTLPEDKEIAKAYSRGEIILSALPCYLDHFVDLTINIARLPGQTTRQRCKSPRTINSLISKPAMIVLPAPGSSARRNRSGCLGSMAS